LLEEESTKWLPTEAKDTPINGTILVNSYSILTIP
jgi:hypothetical protein